MLRLNIIILAGFYIVLSGCVKTGVDTANFADISQLGASEINIEGNSAIYSALNGGILPQDGFKLLDEGGQKLALNAEYMVLEETPSGVSISWSTIDGKQTGKVRATQPYQIGSTTCRQYTHKATVKGKQYSGKGSACRSTNGLWIPNR